MTENEARGDHPRADGWDGLVSVSNRSKGAGQLVMMQIGLIGIGAGAAAALLFASVTSGSSLSIPLFYLAPLPILIAGARLEPLGGADRRAGRRAGARRRVRPGVLLRLPGRRRAAGLVARLSRDAGAARAATAAPAALEWYPPGRLVIWAAVLGALVVVVAIPNFGTRRRKLPRRPAQRADAYAARAKPTRRPMRRAPCPA